MMKCAYNESEKPKEGRLFILSAPSGGGKTTLCRAVCKHFPDILYSVSYTTRLPRPGEKNGVDYYFISKDVFVQMMKCDKWAEWAEVHGNFYGTSADLLKNVLCAGNDILLDIDVQGTVKILEKYPESITIFIMPPSLETLRMRLESRGEDKKDVIERRMINAKTEMEQSHLYQHVIVNENLEIATQSLISLIETCRKNRL